MQRSVFLAVRHPEHARFRRYFGAVPNEIHLVLPAEGAVEGVVIQDDSGTPAPGVDVVVWPYNLPDIGARRALAVAAGQEVVGHVVTDARGAFRVTGLDSADRFNVIAGGEGMVCEQAIKFVQPGASQIKLRVFPAYGVHVRYKDITGGPLRMQLGEFDQAMTAITLPKTVGRLALGLGRMSCLAGIPSQYCRNGEQPEPDGYMYIALADEWVPRIGPIEYTITFPGYLPQLVRCDAVPIRSGIAEETFLLQPRTSSWGRLEVNLRGLGSDPNLTANPRSYLGTVALTEGDQSMRFPLRAAADGVAWVLSVPQGDYLARFENTPLLSWPGNSRGVPVHIGSELAHLDVDLSETGGLRLDFSNDDGSTYEGNATIFLTRWLRAPNGGLHIQDSGSYWLKAPSFLLPAMAVGIYDIRMVTPGDYVLASAEEGKLSVRFEVRAAETTLLRLVQHPLADQKDDR